MMAAIRNSNYYEMALVHPNTDEVGRSHDIYEGDYKDSLDAIDENGHVPVPQGDGLGVTYNWDFIMKNRTGGREYGE